MFKLYSPLKEKTRIGSNTRKIFPSPIQSSQDLRNRNYKTSQNGSVNKSRNRDLNSLQQTSPLRIKPQSSVNQAIDNIKQNTSKIDKFMNFSNSQTKIIKLHRRNNSKIRKSEVHLNSANLKNPSIFNEKNNILQLECENRKSESIFESKENIVNKGRESIIKQRISLNDKIINEINKKMSLMDTLL